jgi:septal ring factor EnvC (AmiA/AmiB activator)
MFGAIKMERKHRTYEARISELEEQKSQFQAKINTYKAKISDCDAKLRELRESKRQQELTSLFEVIKSSGKTPEEIIASLQNSK